MWKLDRDLVIRVHHGEITPAQAQELQTRRDAGLSTGASAPLSAPSSAMTCDQARAAVDAIRPDIAANGPDALRTLLGQTDALLARSTHWRKCQRAARYRAILAAHAAARGKAVVSGQWPVAGDQSQLTMDNGQRTTDSSEASGPPKPQADAGLLPYRTAVADPVPFFDLVVPLGTQSKRADLELRYLLRSALANLATGSANPPIGPSRVSTPVPVRSPGFSLSPSPETGDSPVAPTSSMPPSPPSPIPPPLGGMAVPLSSGLRTIHLIGPRRPPWLGDHPMVRWHDWTPVKPKNHDIVAKFVHAANHPDVAGHFLGSCDDFLFLKPLRPGTDYGAVRRHGVLSTSTDQGYWRKAQSQTRSLLEAAGYKAEFFDYHVPTLMTKAGWRQVDAAIPWRSVPGHAVWSLYHNVAGVHGPSLGRDGRSHCGWHAGDGSKAPASAAEIDRAANGCLFMNYNDGGFRGGVLESWLAKRFPVPAPWERDQTVKTPRAPREPAIGNTSRPIGPSSTGSASVSRSAGVSPAVPASPIRPMSPMDHIALLPAADPVAEPPEPPGNTGRNHILCAFNAPYADYAAVLIHSILQTNPGYLVHAFATNVPEDAFARYPFSHPAVDLHPETRPFPDAGAERNYMVCRRYVRYAEFLGGIPDGDWVVSVDVDAIVSGSLSDLRFYMARGKACVGLVDRGPNRSDRDRIRGHFTATILCPQSRVFWDILGRRLAAKTDAWYSDQRELLAARVEAQGRGVVFWPAGAKHYCAFRRSADTRILVTAGWHPRKRTRSTDWAADYDRLLAEVGGIRHAAFSRGADVQPATSGADPATGDSRVAPTPPLSSSMSPIAVPSAFPADLDILVVLYGRSLPRAAAVARTFARWHRHQQPMARVLCAWCYRDGEAPGDLATIPDYPWLHRVRLPQYDLDDGVFRKEGLLNYLLSRHSTAPHILTLDADVWTPRPGWFRAIRDKLAENPDHVLQPFRYFKDTKENVGAWSWSAQTLPGMDPEKCKHPGLGWAFTRAWVEKHGDNTVFNPWHIIAMGDHAFVQEHILGQEKKIAEKYFVRLSRRGLPGGTLAGIEARVWHENHTNHTSVPQGFRDQPFADRAYKGGCNGLGQWGDLTQYLYLDEDGVPILRDTQSPFSRFLARKSELQTKEATARVIAECLNSSPKAVFCAFNASFVGYAAVLIHSVLTNSPGWAVHAYATNVPADELGRYPFDHETVTIHAETRSFPDSEDERCYMASHRFLRYLDSLQKVSFAVYLDVDQVVMRSLDDVIRETGDADLGIIFRPHLKERNRAIMCAAVAVRPTPAAIAYWREYERCLGPSLEWMGDQLHMIEAVERCADHVQFAPLPESVWNSFDTGPDVHILCTRTKDKLGFRRGADYAREHCHLSAAIAARREAGRTALVYVVFGSDGMRLEAIRRGIAETVSTVDPPGTIILLDAAPQPSLADLAASVSGIVYRHVPTGPRHAGCWQKEAMWEIARTMLGGFPAIQYVVYLDADCVPQTRGFFAQVQRLHDNGAKAAQPWRVCRDTVEQTVGGMSTCWGVSRERREANFWGSQPGFCWSFDLRWLDRAGGLPNVEPLGGGDSLLVNLVFDAARGWNPEAEHMQAMSKTSKVPRQPCAALGVDIKHHTHGPRANRGYHLRYAVARHCLGDTMRIYERDANGLWQVREGSTGDAWLRMTQRRGEWTDREASILRLWREVVTNDSAV